MNQLALAFTTKDRPDLSRHSIEPLLQPNKIDLLWLDGSTTEEGKALPHKYARKHAIQVHENVRGGADAAIVRALSLMLEHDYKFVGIVENDVLLHPDWFGPTMALFNRGMNDGLSVGAVSTRAYVDRILVQREGYALMHNLGAGMVIFTYKAAEVLLKHYRTGHASENRTVFSSLSGLDPAHWNGFLATANATTADWQFDTILARRGFASLALTPSPCEMIGQAVPLHEQGLELSAEPFRLLENGDAFDTFVERSRNIRHARFALPPAYAPVNPTAGSQMFFAHQLGSLRGEFSGEWRLQWNQGFGPFSWRAHAPGAAVEFMLHGAGSALVTGGKEGGGIKLTDAASGQDLAPDLPPESDQITCLSVAGQYYYRKIRVEALSPGVLFCGVAAAVPQPIVSTPSFRWSDLPPVE